MNFVALVELVLEELKIVAPAVKLPSGKVVAGKIGEMHAHIYDRIIRRLSYVNKVPRKVAEKKFNRMFEKGMFESGFIDNEGKFQTRQQAWQIAKGYDKNIADHDKELSTREDGEQFKKMASEFIPGTRAYAS